MKLAPSHKCTACMACVDVCPRQVLQAAVDKDGYYAISKANSSVCIECGRCTKVCPSLNPFNADGTSYPYAAWNRNAHQRKDSASGGVFAALATAILYKGGCVYGASVDGFVVRHKRIEDLADLHMLQGSKYQHSDMTGIYRQVKADLKQGRFVLFSGLGCQVAALMRFLGNTNKDRLFTVDTICGGISTMLPMLALKDSGKYKGIKSFRDKENVWQSKGFRYCLKMVRPDDSLGNLGLDNAVLNTFSSKLLKRSSCLNCQFTGLHRISDCTIGDFWGDTQFKEQHAQGLSVLIVHSDRIKNLIADADMQIETVTWNDVIKGNRNIYWTHYPLIRFFPSRHLALKAMRSGNYPKAKKQMGTWSLIGLWLRFYLKVNSVVRKIVCYKIENN